MTETSEEARRAGKTVEDWKAGWANRADNIAITETTRASTLAELDATEYIDELTGKKLVGIWYTEEDAVVCEVCGPLHGTGPNVYDEVSPGGPPVHPRCRCWLEYEEGESP